MMLSRGIDTFQGTRRLQVLFLALFGACLSAGLTEEEGWAVQGPFSGKVFTSEDAREGPRAFAEKREPKWQGR